MKHWLRLQLLALLLLLASAPGYCISKKGRKYAMSQGSNSFASDLGQEQEPVNEFASSSTADPFLSFDSEESDGPALSAGSRWEDDPFFSEDEADADFNLDSLLPPCELVNPRFVACTNTSSKPQERRFHDPVLSRLISQTWADFQVKLNTDAELFGRVIDPLDVDSHLPEPIDLQQSGQLYSAHIRMRNIMLHGLSGIQMSESVVSRSENLTDMNIRLVFTFKNLLLNGTYSLTGFVGWWKLDSMGEQHFAISMLNANLSLQMHLASPGDDDWAPFLHCSSQLQANNTMITDLQVNIQYEDIDFRFDNLGQMANTAVNGIGIYFLKTQEHVIVSQMRKAIKANVHSLIC